MGRGGGARLGSQHEGGEEGVAAGGGEGGEHGDAGEDVAVQLQPQRELQAVGQAAQDRCAPMRVVLDL